MTKTSSSWSHALQRLPEDAWERKSSCSNPKCDQPTTHLASYNYVTGRAGRVSWAARGKCDTHAEQFRVRHDLPAPEEAPAPKHALERILAGEEG